MPCTLPLPVVRGVLMSPCASTQMRPSGCPSRRAISELADTDPAARLWSPPSTIGKCPGDVAGKRALVQPRAHPGDVADVLLVLVTGPLSLRNRDGQVALVAHRPPERGNPFVQARNPQGRRPHVDASPAGAEIERHADDVDRLHWCPRLSDASTTPRCPRPTAPRSRCRGRNGPRIAWRNGSMSFFLLRTLCARSRPPGASFG